MGIWPSRWYCVIWFFLGFLVLLSGIVSSRVDTIVAGAVFLFVATSTYLTYYVKSEHRVKRALEVIFMLLALGSVIYGYAITRSVILGVITLFIAVMIFIAFTLSYLLPRIHRKLKAKTKKFVSVYIGLN